MILAFCPYARCYRHPIGSPKCRLSEEEAEKYKQWPDLNQMETFPLNSEYAELLRAWQKVFDGEIYAFEYHFWGWDRGRNRRILEFYPPLETIQEDLLAYKKLGADGLLNCMFHLNFLPNSLQIYAMARLLWNPELNLDEFRHDFCKHYFGETSDTLQGYFYDLDPALTLGDDPKDRKGLESSLEVLEGFRQPLSKALLQATDAALIARIKKALAHLDYAILVKQIYLAVGQNDLQEAQTLLKRLYALLEENREVIQDAILLDRHVIDYYLNRHLQPLAQGEATEQDWRWWRFETN